MKCKVCRIWHSEKTGLVCNLRQRVAELEVEIQEWEQSFELYHDATQRGTKLWQEATGQHKVLPDTAKLVAWLLDLVHRAEKKSCIQD